MGWKWWPWKGKEAKIHETVLSASTLGAALVVNRKFTWVNQRVADLLGTSVDRIIGKPTRVIYPTEESFQELGRSAYPLLGQGKRSENVLKLKREDGSEFWCRFIGKALDPSNLAAGSVWMFEDINDSMEAELAFKEKAGLQNLILDHSILGLFYTEDRRIKWCNRRVCEMFGHSLESILGQSTRMFYPTEASWATVAHDAGPLLAQGKRYEGRMQMARADGSTFWGTLVGLALENRDMKGGSVWMAQDVTTEVAIQEAQQRTLKVIAEQVERLKVASGVLRDTSVALSRDAGASKEHTATSAAAATQVSGTGQQVAASVEEISASVGEISKNTTDAARVASEAAEIAGKATESVARLENSSNEIGQVSTLIGSIAQQTNLLALNATIEAARAGEAGKGFAVVAGEVKELARQTGQATQKIGEKIEAIRATAVETGAAIARINDIVGRINSSQQAIASAVEEQSVTMSDLNRMITQSAQGSRNVSAGLNDLAVLAGSTADSAQRTLEAGEEVSGITKILAGELDRPATEGGRTTTKAA
jgi:PAS domain S-box-containing protein